MPIDGAALRLNHGAARRVIKFQRLYIHLEMQYNCTLQIIIDKPVQRGIVLFVIRSNRNLLVSDSLPSFRSELVYPLCFIEYHFSTSHGQLNIDIMNNRCLISKFRIWIPDSDKRNISNLDSVFGEAYIRF